MLRARPCRIVCLLLISVLASLAFAASASAFSITDEHTGPAVTRASLQADLLAAHERAARLSAHIQQLEKRLSEALGEQTWRESGLGPPADIDTLHQRISHLEQHNLDLQQQLDERDEDLAAARAANRELMARLNTPTRLR